LTQLNYPEQTDDFKEQEGLGLIYLNALN